MSREPSTGAHQASNNTFPKTVDPGSSRSVSRERKPVEYSSLDRGRGSWSERCLAVVVPGQSRICLQPEKTFFPRDIGLWNGRL